MHRNRAGDWLKQAQSDLLYARAAFRDGFFAQACFVCQQASEKALKSILYFRGASAVLSHSLHKLCVELEINDEMARAARTLDQYYMTARYPDALAEGTPHEVFTEPQARTAIQHAEHFLSRAEAEVR